MQHQNPVFIAAVTTRRVGIIGQQPGPDMPLPGCTLNLKEVDSACKRGVPAWNWPSRHAANTANCVNSVTEIEEFFLQNNDTAP